VIRLLVGLAAAFALFELLGALLGSDHGQAGLLIAAAVIAALVGIECAFFGQSPATALRELGFGRPAATGLLVAMSVCALLFAILFAYAAMRGATPAIHPGWPLLLPGLFAQAGLAEEALFRGYLFRHLRNGRSFSRASALATLPFVLVHLILFATLPWPVALAAVLLSVILSFPLAYLFEVGGSTVWAPALVHFIVQGTIKVVEVPGVTDLPLIWMTACALVPYLVFLARPSS
jgi:membrane protease YdiL (CAAX protease family)